MKKRGRQTGKERFTIHASLCGGGDLLKALGSVASYLADRLFNLSNDKKLELSSGLSGISPAASGIETCPRRGEASAPALDAPRLRGHGGLAGRVAKLDELWLETPDVSWSWC